MVFGTRELLNIGNLDPLSAFEKMSGRVGESLQRLHRALGVVDVADDVLHGQDAHLGRMLTWWTAGEPPLPECFLGMGFLIGLPFALAAEDEGMLWMLFGDLVSTLRNGPYGACYGLLWGLVGDTKSTS